MQRAWEQPTGCAYHVRCTTSAIYILLQGPEQSPACLQTLLTWLCVTQPLTHKSHKHNEQLRTTTFSILPHPCGVLDGLVDVLVARLMKRLVAVIGLVAGLADGSVDMLVVMLVDWSAKLMKTTGKVAGLVDGLVDVVVHPP